MKNMKKLLGAMAALGFSTVAAVNVVACSSPSATNDLTKSFETSYTKTADATSDLTALGLTKKDETKYTFAFASITDAGIKSIIKPKTADVPVKKGVTVVTTLPAPSAAGDEIAQVTQKTANGDLTVSSDKKTVTYTVTLKLFKGEKQSDNTIKYIDQKTTMDVTLNVNTVDNRTNLSGLAATATVPTTPLGDVNAFATNLVNVLKNTSAAFNGLKPADVNIYKTGTTTPLTQEQIIKGDLPVTVTAIPDDLNFKGTQNITVAITVTNPDTPVSLAGVKTIEAPTTVQATTSSAVKPDEVTAALNPQVQKAVETIAIGAVVTTDYTYKIFTSATGTTELTNNVDLTSATETDRTVYVKISCVNGSKWLTSNTGTNNISILLPKLT